MAGIVDIAGVKIYPDTDGFRSELKREISAVERGVSIEVPVSANTRSASAEMAAWRARQSSTAVNVEVNVDRLGGSVRRVSGLFSSMGRVGSDALGNILTLSTKTGDQMVSLGGVGVSSMTKTATAIVSVVSGLVSMGVQALITSSIILGVAGLVQTAIGGISALLAGLPALISAIGIPLLTVFLGFDQLKEMFGELTSEVNLLKDAVGNAFEKTFKQSIPKIRTLLLGVEGGLVNIATRMSEFANGIVNVVTSSQGLRDVRNMLQGVSIFLDRIAPGVHRFVEESLRIAGTKELYRILGDTVRGVTNQFALFLQKARETGTLERTLRSVRDLAVTATTFIGQLAQSGMEFLTGAAPGITAFFRDLGNFLGRFNWERLGQSFGGVFRSLGEWLNRIPQGTLKNLENAIVNFGNAISNMIDSGAFNIFLGLFTTMVEVAASVANSIATIVRGAQKLVNFTAGFLPGYQVFAKGIDNHNRNIKESTGSMTGTVGGALFGMARDVSGTGKSFGGMNRDATGSMNKLKINTTAAFQGIAGVISNKSNEAQNKSRQNFGKLPGGIRSNGPAARNAAVGVGNGVIRAFGSFVGSAINAGASLARGIGQGIANAARWVYEQAQGLMRGVAALFPHSPAKEGPFSGKGWTPYSGAALVKGFADGIRQSAHFAVGATESMMTDVAALLDGTSAALATDDIAASWQAVVDADPEFGSLGSRIEDALSKWSVVIDRQGLARLVNEANTENRRRG